MLVNVWKLLKSTISSIFVCMGILLLMVPGTVALVGVLLGVLVLGVAVILVLPSAAMFLVSIAAVYTPEEFAKKLDEFF